MKTITLSTLLFAAALLLSSMNAQAKCTPFDAANTSFTTGVCPPAPTIDTHPTVLYKTPSSGGIACPTNYGFSPFANGCRHNGTLTDISSWVMVDFDPAPGTSRSVTVSADNQCTSFCLNTLVIFWKPTSCKVEEYFRLIDSVIPIGIGTTARAIRTSFEFNVDVANAGGCFLLGRLSSTDRTLPNITVFDLLPANPDHL